MPGPLASSRSLPLALGPPLPSMNLRDLFQPSDLLVGFDPTDKWDAIRLLVEHLAASGKIDQALAPIVLEQVVARERSMSTGMERGVAIPHAAVEEIEEVRAAMGIVSREQGLAFDAIDAQPARLVVLLVIPRSKKLLHIRTLADVARVLGQQATREALIAAPDSQAAYDALATGDPAPRR